MSHHSRHHGTGRRGGRSSGRRSAPLPIPEEPADDGSRGLVVAVLVVALLVLGLAGAWLVLGSDEVAPIAPVAPGGTTGPAGAGGGAPVSERPNTPPRAEIRLMRDTRRPHVYQFSGIFSEDRDREDVDRLRYQWDFGDGTSGEDKLGEHVFTRDGEVTVTLTVTDTVGASDTTSQSITIPPLPRLAPSRQPGPEDRPGVVLRRAEVDVRSFAALERAIEEQGERLVVDEIDNDHDIRPRDDHYCMSFRGGLVVERPGLYELHLESDDGSRLVLAGEELVRMERSQSATREVAVVQLVPGVYDLRVDYWQGDGDRRLDFEWLPPGGELGQVPKSALVHRDGE